jgi:CheY-like chemotaxis protein
MMLTLSEIKPALKGGNNLPILVVDDDQAMRKMLETVLLDEGYSVVLARNGKEGLELVNQQRPALVLLDLMMPVMDGWQFLEAIKQIPEYQDLPVLLLSASRQISGAAKENPVKAYLPKPFELVKLLAYIDQYKQDLN